MRTTSSTKTFTAKRGLAALAMTVLVATPLAACGSSDSEGSASSSSSQSAPEPVASIEALQGETTAIALDKGFTDALTSLKLTPGVVGTAKLQDGSLIFPITGGNVTVFKPGEVSPYVIGQIQHEGSGLSLTAGDTKVELTNFNVDPGVSRVYGDVTVNGKVAVTNAFLFQLDGRTLEPLKTEGSNAVLEGTKVEISEDAAPLLNQTFKTDAVKPGLLVGIAKITVNTQSK
ncbi:hypothetical protein [Nocardioides sp.]|uniref:hypothetical protein n=1 Tax=Nocardioides sp. TaxID=35761 RepID=UPI00378471EC